jgi:hypothetical protein
VRLCFDLLFAVLLALSFASGGLPSGGRRSPFSGGSPSGQSASCTALHDALHDAHHDAAHKALAAPIPRDAALAALP